MNCRRFDSAKLGKIEKTPNGFLRVPANLTRIGVLEYRDASGKITRELRHPDHVFAPESIASLETAPITDLHPGEFVNPSNVDKLQVGIVSGTPRRDGKFLSAKLTIQRKDTIEKVESGERKEVSLGYTCIPLPEPGVWEGAPYDVVQTQIKYDHVAIGPVGWGRCGDEVAMRLDSSAALLHDPETVISSLEDLDSMELQERLDAAEAKIKQLESELGKATAQAEAVAKTLEVYKTAERKDARDRLEAEARKVLGVDAKFEGKSDREVREAALLKSKPESKLDSLSDDFVAGAFVYLVSTVETESPRNDSVAQFRGAVERKDGEVRKTPSEVRQEALAKKHGLWISKETK